MDTLLVTGSGLYRTRYYTATLLVRRPVYYLVILLLLVHLVYDHLRLRNYFAHNQLLTRTTTVLLVLY